jgi:hypothetical protein
VVDMVLIIHQQVDLVVLVVVAVVLLAQVVLDQVFNQLNHKVLLQDICNMVALVEYPVQEILEMQEVEVVLVVMVVMILLVSVVLEDNIHNLLDH